jgi:putative heme iron utilization protein
VIEDEDNAAEIFARKRVNFKVTASLIDDDKDYEKWQKGIAALTSRHGKRITQLSQLKDFRLFRLVPKNGRYVKGFGQAYQIDSGSLNTISLSHLTDGHKRKKAKVVA